MSSDIVCDGDVTVFFLKIDLDLTGMLLYSGNVSDEDIEVYYRFVAVFRYDL